MADSNELIFEIKFDIQKMQEEIAGIKANLDSVGTSGSNAFKALDKEIESVKNAMSATSTELENKDKELERLQKRLEELQSAFAAGDFDAGSVLYIDMKKTEDAIKNLIESEIQLSGQYDEQYDKLKELNAQRDKMASGSADETLKAKLRETTIELGNLLMKYREMSAAEQASAEGQALKMKIDELTQKAGALRDTMDDVNSTIKNTASDTGNLDAAVGGINLMAASFGAVQGSMALFGEDSEELAVVMTKLQGVLALTNSLTVIQNQLQKESALRMKLSTLWTKMKTAAMKQSATATASGTAATTAFAAGENVATASSVGLVGGIKAVGVAIKSIPVIGWILAAISALVTLITLIVQANDEEERGDYLEQQRIKNQQLLNEARSEGVRSVQQDIVEMQRNITTIDKAKKGTREWTDAVDSTAKKLGVSRDWLIKNIDKVKDLATVWMQVAKSQAIADEYAKRLAETRADQLAVETEIRRINGLSYDDREEALENLKEEYGVTQDQVDLLAHYMHAQRTTDEKEYRAATNGIQGVVSNIKADLGRTAEAFEAGLKSEMETLSNLRQPLDEARDASDKFTASTKQNENELDKMSKAYKEAFEQMASSDKQIAESGRQKYEKLKAYGTDYLDYLKKERAKIDANEDNIADSGKKKDKEKLEDLNQRITAEQKRLDEETSRYQKSLEDNAARQDKFFETSLKNKESETAKYLADRVKQITDQLNEAKDKEIAALDATYKEIDDKWVELLTYDYKKQHPLAVQSEIDKYISEQREKQGRFTEEEMHEKISKNKEVETANKIKEETAKIYDEQLNKYKSYADKYVQLTKEKNDKIAKLEKNGANKSVIDAVTKDYNKQVEALNESLDPEQVRQLSLILTGTLGVSLESMIELANDLAEELENCTDEDDVEKVNKLTVALNAVNEAIANTQEETEEDTSISEKIFGKTTDETIGKIKEMTDAVADLAGAFDDMTDSEKVAMETSLQMFSDGLNIIQNAAQGNYVGAAASAIGMVTNLISNTSKWSDAMFTEHIDALEKKGNEAVDKIADMIERLSNVRDNSVGLTAVAYSNFIERKFNEEIEALNKEKEELKELLKGNLTTEQREQLEGEIAEIDERILETQKKITDEQERRMEMLTGYSTSSDAVTAFGNAIIKAWENGTSAANEAMGTWEDMLKNFAKQKFLSDFMSKQFEGIFNDYYEQITGDGLSEAEQVEFQNKITALAERGEKFYANLMESMGLANDIALEGTKGSGIAKASQESIDELNGRFLSVQMFTASISGSVERLYQNSTSIMRDVSDIRGFQENISGKIDAMNGYMQDIVNNGIRMN